MKAYQTTNVSVSKSQEAIRQILRKHKADGINFGEEWIAQSPYIFCKFLYTIQGIQHLILFKVPLPFATKTTATGRKKVETQIEKEQSQIERGIWRAVYWAIKSKLESAEFRIETFTEAFLSHFVIPGTEKQIGELIIPQLKAGTLKMIEV